MDNDSQIGVSSLTPFRIVSPHLTSQPKQSQQFPWYHCWQNILKQNLPPLKNQQDITGIIYPTLSFGRIIWSQTHWNLLTLFSVNQIKHRKHFHLNIQLHIATQSNCNNGHIFLWTIQEGQVDNNTYQTFTVCRQSSHPSLGHKKT